MTLYDQYGKEILTNKPILREVAVQTVRDRYSTYPSQGLTPERIAAILKEADNGYVLRQAELFEEMEEKDGHLGAELGKRKLAVVGLDREVLPASDSPVDAEIAKRATEMLEYVEGFDEALLDTMDACGKGFAVQEIMWQLSEGQLWIEELNWIHQKRFSFSGPPQTVNGQTLSPLLDIPRLLTDGSPVYGENLLPNKFVVHRHRARSGATVRGGLIRPCTYLYLFKNYGVKDWLIFAELFSVPMRVGKYKSGATPQDIETLKTAVFNLGVDAAAVISDSTIIEIIESAQRGNVTIFKDLAGYCDKGMTKVILGHTGSTEGTPGKLGGEDQAADVRQDLLEFDAKALERTIRLQIIAPWVRYVYGPAAAVPKVKIYAEEGEDLKSKAETYKTLVDMGYDQIPQSHIQETFGIPKPQNGEATVKPAAPISPFGSFGSPAPTSPASPLQNKAACACGQHHTTRQAMRTDAELQTHADTDWVNEYMKRLAPEFKGAQDRALKDIEAWLADQTDAPTAEEFGAKIKELLGSSYADMDQAAITDIVSDMYRYYKSNLTLGSAVVTFGGEDTRSMEFLSEIDRMFFSSYIKNEDADAALTQFLDERYLSGGEGLFGRGNPETVKDLLNLLGQKDTELSTFQANRIIDTSVQRIRNWAHIAKLADAAISEIEIVEPTEECPFCASMNGRVIKVNTAAELMQQQRDMTPEEFGQYLKDNPATLEKIDQLAASGALPPYHPFCHGRFVVKTKG